MQVIHRFLMRFILYQNLIEWQKNTRPRWFGRLPIYTVVRFFILEIEKDELNTRASAVSFSIFLAIFPTIIFLFTLVPYIPIDNLTEEVLLFGKNLLPNDAYTVVRSTVIDITSNQRGDLLSLGFLLALYFSTNGLYALMSAFTKDTYDIFRTRVWWQKRLVAIGMTLSLSVMLVVAIALIVGSEYLMAQIKKTGNLQDLFLVHLINISKWAITTGLVFSAISLLYFWGAATNKRWRFVSVGSTLATGLFMITSIFFSYYVNNFGQYNKLYGSIGTLIVVMLWIYFNTLSILIGFELNASIYINKRLVSMEQKNTLKKII